MRSHFILYVADQAKSTAFYASVLAVEPTLNVPGMTEFSIGLDSILGLMPEAGAVRLFGDAIDPPALASRSPRAEIYLVIDEAEAYHRRAIAAGGREISAMQQRDWGHRAAYSIDLDGYVVAFADVSIISVPPDKQ